MPTKLEANASFKKPRLVFLVLALALIFSVVFVGGVSGAEFTVSTEEQLRSAINTANSNRVADTIIIAADIVLDNTRTSNRKTLGIPLEITSDITIKNYPGHSYKISTNYDKLKDTDFSIWDYTKVDSYTIFEINYRGKLTVIGNDEGGALTITTNQNGRVFDINSGGTLIISSGIKISNSGFSYDGSDDTDELAESNNGGAVYVRSGGEFIMSGGMLSENKAGAGGAVYVDSGGEFTMNGGAITNNFALNTDGDHDKWGGGVWVDTRGDFNWNVGEINGNTASSAPSGDSNYHEVYPNYNPPSTTPSTPPTPSNPEPPVTNYPIYVVPAGSTEEFGYDTIKEAYDSTSSNYNEFTIYIKQLDFYQTYIEEIVNGGFVKYFDAATIGDGKSVTLKPYGDSESNSITLNIISRMFFVSPGGSLTISGNGNAQITVSGTFSEGTVDGGFIYVNGGSLTVQNGVTISSAKAKNGGAIYLKSGSCTLSGSASITGCAASGKGGAVYVADGTFTVKDSASVDASNDVYLEDGEVITAESGYKGTIGKITLSDYEDGRNVVDITANPGISAEKFVLNLEAHNEYGDKLLVSVDEKSKKYLELKNQIEFLITIPDALYISESSNSGSMIVTADKVRIPKDTWISVTVTSTGNFNLTHSSVDSAKLPYNLFVDDSGVRVTNNLEVAKFTVTEYLDKQTQNLKPTKSLTATVTELPPMTGTYTDTLTFTAEHIDRAFS